MSIRHRCLAVYLAFTVALPISIPHSYAGPNSQAQPVGEVGLRELVALALKNDPKLAALRSRVPVEEAKKRAVRLQQWRDPEIRISHSKEDNIQLDEPYTRSGTLVERISGSGDRTDTGGTNDPTREQSSSSEVRRTTFKEKVIPGEHSDRIIRTETEHRSSNTDTRVSEKRGSFTENTKEKETFRSTQDLTRFDSRDRLARDQTTSVRIRFWLPKPWETKARINQAAKEVDLANYEITAAEREVILEIREAYEDLQYTYKKLRASSSKIAVIKKHVANEEAILASSEELTVDDLGFEDIKIPSLEMEKEALQQELQAGKRALAMRVGLANGSRIRVTDKLLRSTINLQATDLDYLTRMAYVHRGELGILEHEKAITESELDIIKGQRIPWLSFIEGAYAKDSTSGHHTNDNYGFQVGVTLPLFSWLAKDEEVVQARIESYYSSLEANKRHIANEVSEAFSSVKEAARRRGRAEAASAAAASKLEAMSKRLENSEDPLAIEQLRYDVESERDDFKKYILAADRRYNQALIRLEQALGADLDQVFDYKFEAVAGVAPQEDEVLESAAPSTRYPDIPKARPVAKPIDLPSGSGEDPAKPKRQTLFGNLKKSFAERSGDTGDAAPKKERRHGILNRKK